MQVTAADLNHLEEKVDRNYRELKGSVERLEGRMVKNHREMLKSLDANHQELKNLLRDLKHPSDDGGTPHE